MTTLREASAQAMHTLEVIAQTVGLMNYWADAPREVRLDRLTGEAIEALQQALAQPESEHVPETNFGNIDAQQVAVPPTHQQLAQGAFIPQVSGYGAVPSGYVLVPIEPTQSMKEAMTKIIDLYYNPANKKQMYKAAHAYKAMLKAHAIEQAVSGKT